MLAHSSSEPFIMVEKTWQLVRSFGPLVTLHLQPGVRVVDAGASQSPVSSVQGTSCGSHAAHI